MADFIAADSGGQAEVAVITWDIYQIYREMVPAFEDELKTQCPGCEIKEIKSVSPTAPGPELQATVSTLLRRFPNVKYVVPVSDALALGLMPAVEAAQSKPKVVSSEGDLNSLDIIRKGGPQVADAAGPPVETIGWAIVDQVGRVLAGQEPAQENADLARQLYTKDNVGASADDLYTGFRGFEDKYKQLWNAG
jgi:ribose transport system substrate-binding protein